MNKLTVFKWAAIILLGINLFLVGFLILNKPPKPVGPKHKIIEVLDFDEEQKKTFHSFILEHREKIQQASRTIISTKKTLYQTLKSDANNVEDIEELKIKIGEAYASIENNNFQHFKDIKSICKESQLIKFDELTEELSKMFARHPKRPNK